MAKEIDILAIGDVTADAFIRLKQADVHCDLHENKKCELCVRFGDKVPYEFTKIISATGNSANAAVCASRLGLSSAVLAYVGDDENGKNIITGLEKENVDTSYIGVQKDAETNFNYILWYKEERTIFIKHFPFEYSLPEIKTKPKWIYFSSLPEGATSFHGELADFLEKNKDVKLCFQPGTMQIKLGHKKLKKIYQCSDVFICNKAEAQKILSSDEQEIPKLLKAIHELGPKIVVITAGPDGSYTYDTTKDEMYFMPMYPDPKPPYERTGAGDAFSSTFVSALALGKDIKEALLWAPVNSMSVVQYVGAQEGLLSREKLENYIKKAPKDYSAKCV